MILMMRESFLETDWQHRLVLCRRAGRGFTPLMLERLKENEVLLPREFEVIGLFRTRSPTVDSRMMICTLRVMQELYGLGDSVHGVVLRLKLRCRCRCFCRSPGIGFFDSEHASSRLAPVQS